MTCFDSSNCASVVANRYKGRDPSCQHQHSQVSVWLTFLAGNSDDDCFRMADSDIWMADIGILVGRLQTYQHSSWIFILFLAGGCVVLHIVSFFYWGYKSSSVDTSEPQDSTTGEERESSQDSTREPASILELMGEDSVYRFFLTKNWWGWGIALVTVAAQLFMCYIFIVGSEYDFTESISDLKYPWKCPADLDGCRNTIGM